MRQLQDEIGDPKKVNLDPETQKQVDNIVKYISNLKYSSDLNKRVESLIALNDIIAAINSYEKAIQHTANDLISALSHVLIDHDLHQRLGPAPQEFHVLATHARELGPA